MKQDQMMAHLARLRELKLRNEVTELKGRNARLSQLDDVAAGARSSASELAEHPHSLRDLGVLGQLRLNCVRRASELTEEIKTLRQRVYRAHHLAEAVKSARKEIARNRMNAGEQAEDHESDQFFNWRRTTKREH